MSPPNERTAPTEAEAVPEDAGGLRSTPDSGQHSSSEVEVRPWKPSDEDIAEALEAARQLPQPFTIWDWDEALQPRASLPAWKGKGAKARRDAWMRQRSRIAFAQLLLLYETGQVDVEDDEIALADTVLRVAAPGETDV